MLGTICGDWVWTQYGTAGQDKNHVQGWYYLRMLLLLVCCLTVMNLPVLCLLNILRFIPSLRGRNLFADWVTVVVSPVEKVWLLGLQWDAIVILLWISMKTWPVWLQSLPTSWWITIFSLLGVLLLILFSCCHLYCIRGNWLRCPSTYLAPGISWKSGGPGR